MPDSLLFRYLPVPGASVSPSCVTRYCSGESLEMPSGLLTYFCIAFSARPIGTPQIPNLQQLAEAFSLIERSALDSSVNVLIQP